jgi:hypothetical protein
VILQSDGIYIYTSYWVSLNIPPNHSPPSKLHVVYSTVHRPALGPTQPPILWVLGALSAGVKWQGCEGGHSPPSNAELKNSGAIPPLPHTSSWQFKGILLILLLEKASLQRKHPNFGKSIHPTFKSVQRRLCYLLVWGRALQWARAAGKPPPPRAGWGDSLLLWGAGVPLCGAGPQGRGTTGRHLVGGNRGTVLNIIFSPGHNMKRAAKHCKYWRASNSSPISV